MARDNIGYLIQVETCFIDFGDDNRDEQDRMYNEYGSLCEENIMGRNPRNTSDYIQEDVIGSGMDHFHFTDFNSMRTFLTELKKIGIPSNCITICKLVPQTSKRYK